MTGLISDIYHMMKPGKNFHRGFHSWEWIRGQECDPFVPTSVSNLDLSRYMRRNLPENGPFRLMFAQYLNNRAWWRSEFDHYAAQVMRCAAGWLKRYSHRKPWMLWVDPFDPHEPRDPPAEYVSAYSPEYEGIDPIRPSAFTADYAPPRIQAHQGSLRRQMHPCR
ncbi:MAG: hypothetical protein IT210_19730 [Armatimonadetes bacterium]|nr:hypothetical protein [Armatimonadota bacterium]